MLVAQNGGELICCTFQIYLHLWQALNSFLLVIKKVILA